MYNVYLIKEGAEPAYETSELLMRLSIVEDVMDAGHDHATATAIVDEMSAATLIDFLADRGVNVRAA